MNEDGADHLINTLEELKPLVDKNETFTDHVLGWKMKVSELTKLADYFEEENFYDHEALRSTEQVVKRKWNDVLESLNKKKSYLQSCFGYVEINCKVFAVEQSIRDMKLNFQTSLIGNDLVAVEELFEQHYLYETQVSTLGESYEEVSIQANSFISANMMEESPLQKKIIEIKTEYQTLLHMVSERRKNLEEAKELFQLQSDIEEERLWAEEQRLLCEMNIISEDITVMTSLQQRFSVFEGEMRARRARAEMLISSSNHLAKYNVKEAKDVSECGRELKLQWSLLEKSFAEKKKLLERALLACTFYTSANEVESWILENMALCQSKEYKDGQLLDDSLLQQHTKLEGDIKSYEHTLKTLNAQGQKLIQSETPPYCCFARATATPDATSGEA
ncbi:hypothetical protein SK128_001251 [Halocaridina rubra]|uniref:Uncharacterized protein n=1 Tax=Halocaridina rubra TaxID=373956 RepID=A0AAN9FWR4_HALRR